MRLILLLSFALCFYFEEAAAQANDCKVLTKSYFEDNKLAYEQTNVYTSTGLLTKRTDRYLKAAADGYTQEENYAYDTKGNAILATRLLNGKFDRKINRQYDTANRLIKESVSSKENEVPYVSFVLEGNETATFASDGSSNKTSQVKDKNGNLLKETIFGSNGKPMISLENQYGSSDKITQKIRTDLAANTTRKTIYSYDTKQNLIEEKTTLNDEPFSTYINEYDAKGNLTKKTAFNRYGDEDYVLTYVYTPANLLSEELYFYNKQLITKKTTTYDTQGNVTRLDTFERGKLVNYTLITYDCK